MPNGFPKFLGKVDTLRNQCPKVTRNKVYAGRIKETKGLQNVTDPKVKALSHRIVRRKMKREMNKEINNES